MFPEKPKYINVGGKLLDLELPKVMGVINITPDSFYQGSRYNTDEDILKTAVRMMDEGAAILDVGGYSSVLVQQIFHRMRRINVLSGH